MKNLISTKFGLASLLLILSILISSSNAISKDEVNIVLKHLKEERKKHPQDSIEKTVSVNDLECNLDQSIIDEIRSYQNVVNDIIELFTTGEFAGKTYDYLVQMTDTFGNRLTGSEALKDAIEWFVSNSTNEGFTVIKKILLLHFGNEEKLEMTSPRYANMHILGLGSTVPTPAEGITADVFVVSSFEELAASSDKAEGKIVVFNAPFTTYGESISYRTKGAVEAAKAGAVASLTRSVTPFSIDTPHTGWLEYEDDEKTITLHLFMGAENHENGTLTSNTIIEIEGSQYPEEVVVVSGHLDSWDVGAYFAAHGEEKENFQLVMESDMGTFTPYGIDFSGTDEATCMMKEIVSLTYLLGTTETGSPADTSDLGGFTSAGVPTGSLKADTDTYFWYHHSNGDHIEVYDSTNLDKVAALWTSVAYVAADISFRLPQQNFTILE
ncbi:Carboxypeptidase Q [Armadillidium vulgare]|nr:Carboxypeptidase Q [Armadillidium vulgare]